MAVRFAEVARASFSPAEGPTAGLVAALGAGAIGVALLADPAGIEDGPTLCPFRLLTGLPCPGCGLTRSWVYLAHGDWSAAFGANFFGPVAFAAIVVLIVAVVAALIRRRPTPSLTAVLRSPGFIVVSGAWIAYGAVRLALVAGGHPL